MQFLLPGGPCLCLANPLYLRSHNSQGAFPRWVGDSSGLPIPVLLSISFLATLVWDGLVKSLQFTPTRGPRMRQGDLA